MFFVSASGSRSDFPGVDHEGRQTFRLKQSHIGMKRTARYAETLDTKFNIPNYLKIEKQ